MFLLIMSFSRPLRIIIPLFILAALTALGRVFVGVHYPIDIVVGALVGCASGWLIHWFERKEWGKIQRALRIR